MANTTNFNWETPDDTDLVKDGAAAIRTLGSAIDTSLVDLKGGTTGQVLSKATNTDMDFTWVAQDDSNAIQNAIIDAKGDLIVGTANDTPSRLAVGTNGYVLTADSAEASGIKWAAAAGGGKVLQVVQGTTTTSTTSSSTTYADTTLTASITPSATTSKILVMVAQNGCRKDDPNSGNALWLQLLRGSTQLMQSSYIGFTGTASINIIGSASFIYLDSPSTTSSTTYKTQLKNNAAAANAQVQHGSDMSTITLIEIGA